jgi:uncharacterized caspase-like protein
MVAMMRWAVWRADLWLAALLTSVTVSVAAQTQPPQIQAPQAQSPDRVALVIGNARYVNVSPLPNAANDARVMAAALRDVGFAVIDGFDLARDGMEQQIRAFLRKSESARLRLLYYAGHGLQVDGRNYLVPVTTKLESAGDLRFETIGLDSILETLDDPSRTTIVILDACRNNPFAQTLAARYGGTGRGLAPQPGLAGYGSVGAGTLIVFSTAPDKVALDGNGANSPFTQALARHLRTPGLEVRQMLTRVRADVAAETHGAQIPWDNSALLGDVYLAGAGNAAPPRQEPPREAAAPAADDIMWEAIKDSTVGAVFDEFARRFPASSHVREAQARAEELKKKTDVAALPPGAPAQIGNVANGPANAPIARFMRHNGGWSVVFSFADPVTAISWRSDEDGGYRETGFIDGFDPRTRRRIPNPTIELDADQKATTIWVRYVDGDGATQGPFPIRFEPTAALQREQRKLLEMTAGSWVQLQKFSDDLLLYYTHLVSYRCAIRQVRIGIDSTLPDRPIALPPCDEQNPMAIPKGTRPFLKVPPATAVVSVELTYQDGSVSEVKTFRNRASNP